MRKVELTFWRLPLWMCIAIWMVVGCTREWNFSISSHVGEQPEFCFSERSGCGGNGVQLVSIDIEEVDGRGQRVGVAWSLQGHSAQQSDFVIKRLTYGVVPPGWVQSTGPVPLRKGAYYSVMGEFYFILLDDDDVRVYTREEFFKRSGR